MKYISIDVETSGLDPHYSLLSIAAIIEDTNKKLDYDEIPKFHAAIISENIFGEPASLSMNQKLIQLIADYTSAQTLEEKHKIEEYSRMKFYTFDEIAGKLYEFCAPHFNNSEYTTDSTYTSQPISIIQKQPIPIHINCAGKNFGTFDKLFIENIYDWDKYFVINNRVIDPAILFVDWKNDQTLPSLAKCKARNNMDPEYYHVALHDAWDVITLLRSQY